MGTFFVEVLLAAPTRPERREVVGLLVDSGSTYTWVGCGVRKPDSALTAAHELTRRAGRSRWGTPRTPDLSTTAAHT